ncbi:hypothetical protein SAY87_026905 [Trapa incisa]|uniref:Uncharacterized protein n=1 Tax=Trapa incisa TaxID=236973 RepID=A0AAN7GMI5_9MYRT|nr:hypothetical protein SAY87_026905 [Trapa incisa]
MGLFLLKCKHSPRRSTHRFFLEAEASTSDCGIASLLFPWRSERKHLVSSKQRPSAEPSPGERKSHGGGNKAEDLDMLALGFSSG